MPFKLLSFLLAAISLFPACTPKQQVMDTSSAKSTASLQETYWKLTELMGKPVAKTPADKREIHIKFRKDENRLEGYAGCNTIRGLYTLNEANRIAFSSLISTKMYCPEIETEQMLIKALETADNYSISGEQLSLNRAKMAPLARFEAVYFN